MLQVNTSGETSKSGLAPLHTELDDDGECDSTQSLEVVELASHVISSCKKLHLLGVMTIGSYEASADDSQPNPDFVTLRQTRDALEAILNQNYAGSNWGKDGKLLMSMGMSSDFEAAIKAGSDIVRVGTSIFGQRPRKQ
jgi:PLP dependent protein